MTKSNQGKKEKKKKTDKSEDFMRNYLGLLCCNIA